MFSRGVVIKPARKTEPYEFSCQREEILNKIATMRRLKQSATTSFDKDHYESLLEQQVEALRRLNAEQSIQLDDLELKEAERGFEIIDKEP